MEKSCFECNIMTQGFRDWCNKYDVAALDAPGDGFCATKYPGNPFCEKLVLELREKFAPEGECDALKCVKTKMPNCNNVCSVNATAPVLEEAPPPQLNWYMGLRANQKHSELAEMKAPPINKGDRGWTSTMPIKKIT